MSYNARKTHCLRGHEFTPGNIVWSAKGRACRTCKRDLDRRRRAAAHARRQP